mmetsp:Transcript_26924/g.58582  ORF Transcript_26924/g.58582 Transcript_26924/m.58582 type:complete len:250 (+) Transcript_26924:1828-2577(+)
MQFLVRTETNAEQCSERGRLHPCSVQVCPEKSWTRGPLQDTGGNSTATELDSGLGLQTRRRASETDWQVWRMCMRPCTTDHPVEGSSLVPAQSIWGPVRAALPWIRTWPQLDDLMSMNETECPSRAWVTLPEYPYLQGSFQETTYMGLPTCCITNVEVPTAQEAASAAGEAVRPARHQRTTDPGCDRHATMTKSLFQPLPGRIGVGETSVALRPLHLPELPRSLRFELQGFLRAGQSDLWRCNRRQLQK